MRASSLCRFDCSLCSPTSSATLSFTPRMARRSADDFRSLERAIVTKNNGSPVVPIFGRSISAIPTAASEAVIKNALRGQAGIAPDRLGDTLNDAL